MKKRAKKSGTKNTKKKSEATSASRERSARRALLLGTLWTAIGIALAGTVDKLASGQGENPLHVVGSLALLLGWATLGYGLHTFGRLGAA